MFRDSDPFHKQQWRVALENYMNTSVQPCDLEFMDNGEPSGMENRTTTEFLWGLCKGLRKKGPEQITDII